MLGIKLKSDILFSGYYGQSNVGDDAFVEVASWGAEKYWGMSNNIFLAPANKLPKVRTRVDGYPFSIPNTYRFQRRLLAPHTKYVVSAGGSTLCREILASDIKAIAAKRKAAGRNLKIGGIGVSVGPFKSSQDERSIVSYLKQLDFLAVRDQASYDFVTSLHLPYTPVNAFDLAALLPKLYGYQQPLKSKQKNKVIGVSVCPYESIVSPGLLSVESERNRKMVELLKRLDCSENLHMRFFVINGNSRIGDLKLTMETIDRVRPSSYEIVPYNRETQLIWNKISECDFVISTRLHAAIFACFSDTPFMLNEYHRKCNDFLVDIGQQDDYRLFNNEYSPADKAEIILRTLNDDYVNLFPSHKEKMICRAELNFTEVDL